MWQWGWNPGLCVSQVSTLSTEQHAQIWWGLNLDPCTCKISDHWPTVPALNVLFEDIDYVFPHYSSFMSAISPSKACSSSPHPSVNCMPLHTDTEPYCHGLPGQTPLHKGRHWTPCSTQIAAHSELGCWLLQYLASTTACKSGSGHREGKN